MSDDNKKKEKHFLSQIIVPVVIALAVGGTAPWWIEFIKGSTEPQPTGNSGSSSEKVTDNILKNSSISESPGNSSISESPGNSSISESPGNSSISESPGNSSNPESPGNSSNPESPGNSSNPESPGNSSNPEPSGNSSNPEPSEAISIPQCSELKALYSWWSPSREDNFATTNSNWSGRIGNTRHPDYELFNVEGYVFKEQKSGTIPLYSWYSPDRGDNFITSDSRWAGDSGDTRPPDYRFVRVEGYIYDPNQNKPEGSHLVQLSSFWSLTRGDNYATTNPEFGSDLDDRINPDYLMYRPEGFLYSSCGGS